MRLKDFFKSVAPEVAHNARLYEEVARLQSRVFWFSFLLTCSIAVHATFDFVTKDYSGASLDVICLVVLPLTGIIGFVKLIRCLLCVYLVALVAFLTKSVANFTSLDEALRLDPAYGYRQAGIPLLFVVLLEISFNVSAAVYCLKIFVALEIRPASNKAANSFSQSPIDSVTRKRNRRHALRAWQGTKPGRELSIETIEAQFRGQDLEIGEDEDDENDDDLDIEVASRGGGRDRQIIIGGEEDTKTKRSRHLAGSNSRRWISSYDDTEGCATDHSSDNSSCSHRSRRCMTTKAAGTTFDIDNPAYYNSLASDIRGSVSATTRATLPQFPLATGNEKRSPRWSNTVSSSQSTRAPLPTTDASFDFSQSGTADSAYRTSSFLPSRGSNNSQANGFPNLKGGKKSSTLSSYLGDYGAGPMEGSFVESHVGLHAVQPHPTREVDVRELPSAPGRAHMPEPASVGSQRLRRASTIRGAAPSAGPVDISKGSSRRRRFMRNGCPEVASDIEPERANSRARIPLNRLVSMSEHRPRELSTASHQGYQSHAVRHNNEMGQNNGDQGEYGASDYASKCRRLASLVSAVGTLTSGDSVEANANQATSLYGGRPAPSTSARQFSIETGAQSSAAKFASRGRRRGEVAGRRKGVEDGSPSSDSDTQSAATMSRDRSLILNRERRQPNSRHRTQRMGFDRQSQGGRALRSLQTNVSRSPSRRSQHQGSGSRRGSGDAGVRLVNADAEIERELRIANGKWQSPIAQRGIPSERDDIVVSSSGFDGHIDDISRWAGGRAVRVPASSASGERLLGGDGQLMAARPRGRLTHAAPTFHQTSGTLESSSPSLSNTAAAVTRAQQKHQQQHQGYREGLVSNERVSSNGVHTASMDIPANSNDSNYIYQNEDSDLVEAEMSPMRRHHTRQQHRSQFRSVSDDALEAGARVVFH